MGTMTAAAVNLDNGAQPSAHETNAESVVKPDVAAAPAKNAATSREMAQKSTGSQRQRPRQRLRRSARAAPLAKAGPAETSTRHFLTRYLWRPLKLKVAQEGHCLQEVHQDLGGHRRLPREAAVGKLQTLPARNHAPDPKVAGNAKRSQDGDEKRPRSGCGRVSTTREPVCHARSRARPSHMPTLPSAPAGRDHARAREASESRWLFLTRMPAPGASPAAAHSKAWHARAAENSAVPFSAHAPVLRSNDACCRLWARERLQGVPRDGAGVHSRHDRIIPPVSVFEPSSALERPICHAAGDRNGLDA